MNDALRLGPLFFVIAAGLGLFGCTSSSTNPSAGSGGSSGSSGTGGAGALGACVDGTDDQLYAENMVGCDGQEDQCTAEGLCTGGWHLCRYTEYMGRGGEKITPSQGRWLNSCIREYGTDDVTCPTDMACTKCDSSSYLEAPINWDCSQKVLQKSVDGPLGAETGTSHATEIAGCADAGCAFVVTTPVTQARGAMCCR